MLSRICGTFHPLESLYLKVCGPPLWNEGLDWNLRMSAFSNPNEITWRVNWCNKSSESSRDVLLKAVKGCPSNNLVHWADIIKGAERLSHGYMEAIHARIHSTAEEAFFDNAGSSYIFLKHILACAPKCTVSALVQSKRATLKHLL